MDRSIIAPYKAEEKELSDKLYRKLGGLMLIYPQLSEEFRRSYTTDMFLKPNPTAFFQVMHFLFCIYDPNEFKRRFYWPISDKRSESTFRSSTVEYLKFLSDKHQLNWNIKSYLVVMPYGMKFIVFLLDLVGLVIQEQVRLREKLLGAVLDPNKLNCQLNCRRMQKQNGLLKEYASHYITEVDAEICSLRSKSQEMKLIILKFESLISRKINKEFLNDLQVENENLFDEKFLKHGENIQSLEKPLDELRESIEKFQNKAKDLQRDKGSLQQTLRNIASSSSSEFEDTICARIDGPTMNSMTAALVMITPKIENWMAYVFERNQIIDGNISFELVALKTAFQELETQLLDFQKKYNPSRIPYKDALPKDIVCSLASKRPLLFKYIYTPPIKFKMAENNSARLPLQDETNTMSNYGNYLTLLQTTVRKRKKENTRDQSFHFNNSLNNSKNIDAAHVLRSIYSAGKSKRSGKPPTEQQKNLSLLGLKWKERQIMMFGTEKENVINHPKSPIGNISTHEEQNNRFLIKSPNNPFNTSAGELTRIEHSVSYGQSPLNMFPKKPLVVKKVQDASRNIRKMSVSPSGRLDLLTPQEEYPPHAAEHSTELNKVISANDNKNDENLLNSHIRCLFDSNGPNDDEIFNTSDTILDEIM